METTSDWPRPRPSTPCERRASMAEPAPSDDARSEPAGTYWIETWGCQMNVLDTEKLSGALASHGYGAARSPESADVLLLNTCAIREKAEEKVFSELGRLLPIKESNPKVVLGVCGCVAQQVGSEIFARAPYVDFVIGPRATASLPILVNRLRSGDEAARHVADVELRDDSIAFPYEQIRRDDLSAGKAFVTVIEGCNHRCSFCVVPRTRGPEVCRPLEEVLEEVRHLAALGVREIEYLGQTVNAYRDAAGRSLGDLVVATADIEGIERIRFTTSHPAQMTARLIDAMRSARPKLCPYLHLPVQSGSSRVLRAMRRGYDRAAYLGKIEALRARMPEMRFGTDVIVGFPGETTAEFEETLTLLDAVRFDTVYSFVYSERPGTAAVGLGGSVPGGERFRRLQELQSLQRTIQAERNEGRIGQSTEVLVQGPSKRDPRLWTGRNPEARVVHFPGDTAPGRLECIRVTASTAYSLRGEIAASP